MAGTASSLPCIPRLRTARGTIIICISSSANVMPHTTFQNCARDRLDQNGNKYEIRTQDHVPPTHQTPPVCESHTSALCSPLKKKRKIKKSKNQKIQKSKNLKPKNKKLKTKNKKIKIKKKKTKNQKIQKSKNLKPKNKKLKPKN